VAKDEYCDGLTLRIYVGARHRLFADVELAREPRDLAEVRGP
jgi:hypothetical protein